MGPVEVANRFMRSATWDAFANLDGTPQEPNLRYMSHLARGRVGLILPAAMACDPRFATKTMFGMWNERHVECWRPVVDSIHANGGKVFFQLCIPCLKPRGDMPIRVPSARGPTDYELTTSDVDESIDLFLKSAALSVRSGADGIQLHCAHGSFLSAFLSPIFNRRSDKWGGGIPGGVRLIGEILRGIRQQFPGIATSIKFNSDDCMPGGIVPATATDIVRALLDLVDLFEVSRGIFGLFGISSSINRSVLLRGVPKEKQNALLAAAADAIKGVTFAEEYNKAAAQTIRRAVPAARLALVGGNRQLAKMEKLVSDGVAEIVSLSRPLLKNPYLVREFYEGKARNSDCLNCGSCILRPEGGIICHANRTQP
jgi:2,4-dienoyl-CoA reductase-like NADH-dependent reductase (Old Yellow Enzyme family)